MKYQKPLFGSIHHPHENTKIQASPECTPALPELTTFSANIRSIALAQEGSDSRREHNPGLTPIRLFLLLPQKYPPPKNHMDIR